MTNAGDASTNRSNDELIITPRILEGIWKCLDWHGLFMQNLDAPSVDEFLAHYTHPVQCLTLEWADNLNRLTYLYDLSINQAQVTPAIAPYARRVNEANQYLWKILRPEWLEANGNWMPIWFKAAEYWDIAPIKFILEQGFDVNTIDESGKIALFYAVGPFGGRLELVELLAEAGANFNLPGNTIDILLERSQEGILGRIEMENAALIDAYLRNM
ncbi:hypothetical protein GCM10028807_07010 [Spirosoma daeguense]